MKRKHKYISNIFFLLSHFHSQLNLRFKKYFLWYWSHHFKSNVPHSGLYKISIILFAVSCLHCIRYCLNLPSSLALAVKSAFMNILLSLGPETPSITSLFTSFVASACAYFLLMISSIFWMKTVR